VTIFWQIIFNSASLASVYILLAVGLTVYLGIFGILNFAQGDFGTVGGYVTFGVITATGLQVYVASLAGILAGVIVGAIFYFVILKPLWKAPPVSQILATYGFALLAEGLLEYFAGTTPKAIAVSAKSVDIFGAYISVTSLIDAGIAVGLIVGLFLILFRTQMGRWIRAVSEDNVAARLMGIPVQRVAFFVCILGGGLSAAAGIIFLTSLYLTPSIGFSEIFQAFTVVVVAGLGNVTGVLWAGALVAIANSTAAYYLGDAVGQLAGFAIVVIVLLVRPTGLGGSLARK
jgi:branched-chain amino acid transport system permease protein